MFHLLYRSNYYPQILKSKQHEDYHKRNKANSKIVTLSLFLPNKKSSKLDQV